MKISEVTIEYFRSIKKASFVMHDLTAVVGENNAGKTAVLRALNCVMNFKDEEQNFVKRYHQYAARTNTYITLTFRDIPDKDEYRNLIFNDAITLKFFYSYSETKQRYTFLKGKEKIPATEASLRVLFQDIIYVYIPTGRSEKEIDCSQETVFKKLLFRYAEHHTEKRDKISSNVKAAASKIHDTVLVKLEKEINSLYMQEKDTDFSISFPSDLDYNVLLNFAEISLSGTNTSYRLQDWGSGTTSLAIIAMHRANAKIDRENIVLGIEEPEMNLHPQAQKRFIRSLMGQLSPNEPQAIFTTHSTVLVDELDHRDILLARRVVDQKRGFHTEINQISDDFWLKHHIDDVKHKRFFQLRNSDFFFSKFVVVAESSTDVSVLQSLLDEELGNLSADVSFLNSDGVDRLKYPYFLLKELQIPFVFVVDHDFFFEYAEHNNLEASRNKKSGLPSYSNKIKNHPIIKDLIKSDSQENALKDANSKGYRALFEVLSSYDFLIMHYCLEMDLSCSSAALEKYFEFLKLKDTPIDQCSLLTQAKGAIKKPDVMLDILASIPKRAYPESYLKIKKTAIKKIRESIIGSQT